VDLEGIRIISGTDVWMASMGWVDY